MRKAHTFEDEIRTCRACGKPWIYCNSEQAWMAARAMQDPARCQACRRARKREREMSTDRLAAPFE